MLEFISKLSFNRGVSIALIVFGTFIAPYWFLFQFASDVYKENTVVQLVILSVAIGAPTAMVHYLMNVDVFAPEKFEGEVDKAQYHFSMLGGCSVLSGCFFYLPCIIKFKEPALTQHDAIVAVCAFNGLFIVLSVILQVIFSRAGAKKNRKPQH